MKKTFNRILVIATGVILIAAAATIRQAKAAWQYGEAYGYQVWCDVGRFCSGPASSFNEEFWNLMGMVDPYWDTYWRDNMLWWNPQETHYGICEWIPPFGIQYIPCACVEMQFFAILEEGTPSCGYAVPIS